MFSIPSSIDVSRQTQAPGPGTKDGQGAGDHDQPYAFGRRPRALAPFPFTTRQYARLLVLRSRVRDQDCTGGTRPCRQPS
jgi:hypothetical protein